MPTLNYNVSFNVSQKSPVWFDAINCSLLFEVLLLMFEYFYDAYYTIYQFLTVHPNEDYYFCKLFAMLSHEHDWF